VKKPKIYQSCLTKKGNFKGANLTFSHILETEEEKKIHEQEFRVISLENTSPPLPPQGGRNLTELTHNFRKEKRQNTHRIGIYSQNII
jgi:hypothetical protein